jgi:hypothetical protein
MKSLLNREFVIYSLLVLVSLCILALIVLSPEGFLTQKVVYQGF